MVCRKCGKPSVGELCDSCRFHEMNRQCWRCRLYLPKVELQQWRGQWYCPYCIMEIRDEERRMEEAHGSASRKISKGYEDVERAEPKPFGSAQKEQAPKCEKCGEVLDVAYIVNGHSFCNYCFNKMKEEWSKKEVVIPPYIVYRVGDEPGILIKLLRILKRKIREEWKKRIKKSKEE